MEIRTECRADVQTVSRLSGDPVLVGPDKLLDELKHGFTIERLGGGSAIPM